MVVATVVGSTLLVGADVNSGSNEGLEAFVASLAAAAGATAAQVSAPACRHACRHQQAGISTQQAGSPPAGLLLYSAPRMEPFPVCTRVFLLALLATPACHPAAPAHCRRHASILN